MPPITPSRSSNQSAQPAALLYGSALSTATEYASPGALVVAGRDNYQDPIFKSISSAGGTVLMYLDTIIDNPTGRYHAMLMQDSECGNTVPRWPGSPRANQWGFLNDFRVGGVEQAKLTCVLETMVSENPQMGGFLADDLGSRSWFTGFDWPSWSATDQQSYRDGAVAIMQTFRQVADRHGLLVVVNGSWSAGSIAQEGGGYPNLLEAGNALADGSVIEHHDDQSSYFLPNACSRQWARASPVTHGQPVMFAVNRTDEGRDTYGRSPCIAYTVTQSDYNTVPIPWTDFHFTNLPSRAR